MSAVEREFNVGGLNIAALEWPGDGLPIIALHGWLDNAASFAPLAEYFGDYHLLALDLPGHGHSDHLPSYAHYHLADHISLIAAVADEMGWKQFVLLGHSMGAGIASLVAATMPHRVMALSLIDGLAPLVFTPEREIETVRRLFSDSEQEKPVRPFKNRATAAKIRCQYSHFPISLESARIIAERNLIEKNDGCYWRHDQRLLKPSTHYYCEEQVLAVLEAISAPALLIKAAEIEADRWPAFTRLTDNMPDLAIERLEGGHHLHMENSAAVAESIMCFYQALDGGAV